MSGAFSVAPCRSHVKTSGKEWIRKAKTFGHTEGKLNTKNQGLHEIRQSSFGIAMYI